MAILHSELFPIGYPLVSRQFFQLPAGPLAIVAPARAIWIRASANGSGGFRDGSPGFGGGAAFAFDAETCAPGDAFTVQVGNPEFARTAANTGLGDSWVKRANASLLVSADRGRPDGTAGQAANCTGSVTRNGSAGSSVLGGASAGDLLDDFPLGFGGRGASATQAAYYGGGGGYNAAGSFPLVAAGCGMVCVEFFLRNPGY